MRLKHLKLAGFKSFVDPTIIPFPSQLVAVVGPNGCGKSNIIDAVRWVMGESSAKNLRGESMVDVIFNGSSNRKPVGQASVELIFDNNMGRLTGQYAAYQEVAVKRVVTRDGESAYFLNGTRCRRRDINDIFLGTGAGARGYAIIGQDMIARIIEARPEELRAYLEEAAGVSKYKERRRETLNRISHTRENLDRVNDIRNELGKQLARLEKQAKAAERYKLLKAEERQCKAEILALKWRDLHDQETAINQRLKADLIVYEGHQSKLASLQNEQIVQQETLYDKTIELQTIQEHYYQLGNEIARLEENIHQKRLERQRIIKEQADAEQDWKEAIKQQETDAEQLELSAQTHSQLEETLKSVQADFDKQQENSQIIQQQAKEIAELWQTFQNSKNQVLYAKDKASMNLEHIESRRQVSLARIEKIKVEQTSLNTEILQQELQVLVAKEKELNAEFAQSREIYNQSLNETAELRQQLNENEKKLRAAQQYSQQIITEHAVLLAAQQSAITANNHSSSMPEWQDKPRLVELLDVEDKWQRACELVLGESLQGIVLESCSELLKTVSQLTVNSAVFVTQQDDNDSKKIHPRLIDKLKGTIPYWMIDLQSIFAAEHLDEALLWLPELANNESVVTVDGYWLGYGWLKILKPQSADGSSLLARKKNMEKLAKKITEAKHEVQRLQAICDDLHRQIEGAINQTEERKFLLSETSDQLQNACALKLQKEQALNQSLSRQQTLEAEIDELKFLIETLAEEAIGVQIQLDSARSKSHEFNETEAKLNLERQQTEVQQDAVIQQLEQIRNVLHETRLKHDREKLTIAQLTERIHREYERIERLKTRYESLTAQLKRLDVPEADLTQPLEEKNNQYLVLEQSLKMQREHVESIQSQIQDMTQICKQEEIQAKTVQEKMQQQQLEAQAIKVRAAGLMESMAELVSQPQTLFDGLSEVMTPKRHEQDLATIQDKIKRLGAINLVAIEEYQNESERKRLLDHQHDDLSQALETLEEAIAKMDKETEMRFKDTYDQVNVSFQALFPRLFGGGRAKLELTCDNLLEAGILVIAQPPGKRNSTIHMLSGGEKAMTAVALVFAIFQLNPAPFCLLDEVDAPLDDANVRRFCALVKEMSHYVQFLFITHNKVTMELADQLIGVTMREPGVSRIVAVDVEEALNYSEQKSTSHSALL